jgi:hypothetical protein
VVHSDQRVPTKQIEVLRVIVLVSQKTSRPRIVNAEKDQRIISVIQRLDSIPKLWTDGDAAFSGCRTDMGLELIPAQRIEELDFGTT